ncbi:MAG: peptidyl-prolyl cis-trans isomerase, partial [Thermoanaerobaculia bacterium]|nr:peptidyl-prolyl cis-trans isomerase [Thermoanaerobaculia bacterium]
MATYSGGSVRQSEYETWRAFQGRDDVEAAPTVRSVEDLLIVRTLAEAGEASGLAQESAIRLSLETLEQQAWVAALRRHVADEARISPEEVDEAIAREPDAFQKPRRQRIRNLFLRVSADASGTDRAEVGRRLETLRARALAGESFADLASQYSDSQTRFKGG